MLAAALAICLAVTGAMAFWSWRVPDRWRATRTMLVAVVPLAALVGLVAARGVRGSSFALQVVGQYAFLLDTISLGSDALADVRVDAPARGAGGAAQTRLWYVPGDSTVTVRTEPGAPPVFLGRRPVNASPLGGRARVQLTGKGDTVRVDARMPHWPFGCLARVGALCGDRVWTVHGPTGTRKVRSRATEGGVWSDAIDPSLAGTASFVVFRRGGRVYLGAGGRGAGEVRVNGAALPNELKGDPDEVQIGLGREVSRLRVAPDTRTNRLLLTFGRGLIGERWPLEATSARTVHRVSYAAAVAPGTLPLVDLAGVPLGPAAPSYAGALEWTGPGQQWRWHTAGRERALEPDRTTLLPGTGNARTDRGHLIRLVTQTRERDTIVVIAVMWLLGAALLSFNARTASRGVPFLRTGVIGLVYTLAFVRSVVAVRVTHAEPHNADAVPTTLVFLAAFPVLVFLLERWGEGEGRRIAGLAWLRGQGIASMIVHAGLAIAATSLTVGVAAGGIERGLFAGFVVGVGTVGLALLQSLLIPADARRGQSIAPLDMLELGAERGFGRRHLIRGVTTLLVLVVLYIALSLSLRGLPPYLSITLYAVGMLAVYAWAEVRDRVRPRMSPAIRRGAAGIAAVTSGLLSIVLLAEWKPGLAVVPLIARGLGCAALAAGAVWSVLAPLGRRLTAWPYRRRDILPPIWFAATPVVVLMLAPWGFVRRLGITLGFALALAALLLVVRVFTVLWHVETQERVEAHLRGIAPSQATRRRAPLFLLLALSVYGGYLGADRGLLLLLFTAALVTVSIGAALLGPRRLAASAAGLVLALSGVFAWLRIDPRELGERPIEMATPQIRFAAVRHPAALERQMLVAPAPRAREIVSTLQQDWGMRAYAASGGVWGTGLYGTPYTRRAISEDVALTDNAFAVFVLSEHGFAGGVALLAVYISLALLLLTGARVAGRSVHELPRGILLAGLATYVAIPALYMAAANVSLLPLTGQNMPLLGLRSGADVAFGAWLLALAVIAQPRAQGDGRGAEERRELNRRGMRRFDRIVIAVGAALVLVAVLLSSALWSATHRTTEPFQLAAFANGLRGAIERADIAVAGDSIVPGPAAQRKPGYREGDFVRGSIDRANAFADRRADFRTHCAERSPWLSIEGTGVQVSDAPCTVESPLPSGAFWRGELVARTEAGTGVRDSARVGSARLPVLAGVGSGAVLAPVLGDATSQVTCADTAVARSADVSLACDGAGRAHVRLVHTSAVLRATSLPGSVRVNGRAASASDTLHPGDIIALDSSATWVVDDAPAGAFAYARRRNGEAVRSVMPETPAVLARLDSLLVDGLHLTSGAASSEVEVTLDREAMSALQRGLERRCGDPALVLRRCSIMLVDAERGDILALAGWERPGLNPPRYAPVEPNFRNHRSASTIKPIMAMAVLNEYPRLRTLVVEHPADRFTAAAGWSLGNLPVRSALNGCPRTPITWECFIPTSNNLYAVTLGFLGSAPHGADGLPAFDVRADGPAFTIDGRRMAGRARFEMVKGQRTFAHSPLARQLEELFDARIGRVSGDYDETLWRAAAEHGLLRVTPAWQRVSPELPQLPLDLPRFGDLRYLAGFMIGENENNWSNAALVRGMARIMTGRGVELRLLRRIGDTLLPPAEKPGVRFGAARTDVLAAMRNVVRGYGTAARVTDTMFTNPGFELYGKTGTLTSEAFDPLSMFLFGGRDSRPAGKGAACPVTGIVYVEGEKGVGPRLSGVAVFGTVVAPVLRARFGWSGNGCALRAGEAPVKRVPVTRVAVHNAAPRSPSVAGRAR